MDKDPLVILNDLILWEEFFLLLKNICKIKDVGINCSAFKKIIIFKLLVYRFIFKNPS